MRARSSYPPGPKPQTRPAAASRTWPRTHCSAAVGPAPPAISRLDTISTRLDDSNDFRPGCLVSLQIWTLPKMVTVLLVSRKKKNGKQWHPHKLNFHDHMGLSQIWDKQRRVSFSGFLKSAIQKSKSPFLARTPRPIQCL